MLFTIYTRRSKYHGMDTWKTGRRPLSASMTTIISTFTFFGTWRQTTHYSGIGGQLDECTASTSAWTDPVAGSRTPGRRVTVGVARSTEGWIDIVIFHRWTSRHACAVRQEVTTFPALVRALINQSATSIPALIKSNQITFISGNVAHKLETLHYTKKYCSPFKHTYLRLQH